MTEYAAFSPEMDTYLRSGSDDIFVRPIFSLIPIQDGWDGAARYRPGHGWSAVTHVLGTSGKIVEVSLAEDEQWPAYDSEYDLAVHDDDVSDHDLYLAAREM